MKFRLYQILIGLLVLIQGFHAWLDFKSFALITDFKQLGISRLERTKSIEFYCGEFNLASIVIVVGIVILVVEERRHKRKASSLVQSEQRV